MISKTAKDFQNELLKKISFLPYKQKDFTIYKNIDKPQLGYFIKYTRNDYYDFSIGDYTIPEDFSLSFNHNEEIIRFGTVYSGSTQFELENSNISSFSPSSFFVYEKSLKGQQTWKQGQHFHGAEITIYKKYFEKVLSPSFPQTLDFDKFITNYTYHYLPLEIAYIVNKLRNMADSNSLTLLYLESKILECIALINNEITSNNKNSFTNQINYGKITIGKHRHIELSFSDILSIQKAYDILTSQAFNPPTIKTLSKMVFLNEQKLQAGFKLKYHMTINQYTSSMKIAAAENLLSTTDLSIDEIAKKIGYNHSSNFINMFKKIHGKTPLSFKKQCK